MTFYPSFSAYKDALKALKEKFVGEKMGPCIVQSVALFYAAGQILFLTPGICYGVRIPSAVIFVGNELTNQFFKTGFKAKAG